MCLNWENNTNNQAKLQQLLCLSNTQIGTIVFLQNKP